MIALFVALGGTAGAVVTAAVPLAKRALVADNSKKLGGQTAGQITAKATTTAFGLSPAGPRPASTASATIAVKTAPGALATDEGKPFSVSCDAGQRVAAGGFSTEGAVIAFDSYPANGTTWTLYLVNLNETAPANLTLHATCVR
jgi:hypothetical protein